MPRPNIVNIREELQTEEQLIASYKNIARDEDNCKWQEGKIASEWTERYAEGRTDADFARLVGSSLKTINYRRRCWDTFGCDFPTWGKLTWSHFREALPWTKERKEGDEIIVDRDDAIEWLTKANKHGWSVDRMVEAHDGKSKAHVSNNSGEMEWFTPPEIIASARDVMGGIDLDPASDEKAQQVVNATRFLSKDDDGTTAEWSKRKPVKVWMNPPYGQAIIGNFCERLAAEWDAGKIEAACVLVNNATETEWFQTLSVRCAAICFPKGRIRFWNPDRESLSPLQGQAILYLGLDTEKFCEVFSQHGRCFIRK